MWAGDTGAHLALAGVVNSRKRRGECVSKQQSALDGGMRKRVTPVVFVAPTLLVLAGVILIPELWGLVLSLFRQTYGEPTLFRGLSNYTRILSDPAFWNAFKNNVLFVALAVSVESVLGLGIALLLHRGFPLRRLWIALIIAPYALSEVVGVVMWKYMLNPDYGLVNYTLSFAGVSGLNWFANPTLSFASVVVLDVWRYAPFTAMILYAALMTIPRELFEAARIDGAAPFQVLKNIMLPLIVPAFLVALVFRIIYVFRTFGIIWILTKGGPLGATEVLSIYLYKQGFRYWNFGVAAAVAFVMLVMTFLASIYVLRRMHRRMFESRGG